MAPCYKGGSLFRPHFVYVSQQFLFVVSWLLVARRLFQHKFLLCLFRLIPLYMGFYFDIKFGSEVFFIFVQPN